MCWPSLSMRKIVHSIPSLWASMSLVTLSRTLFRGAPNRIILRASSTPSADSCSTGNGAKAVWLSLAGVLISAINHHEDRKVSHKETESLEAAKLVATGESVFTGGEVQVVRTPACH